MLRYVTLSCLLATLGLLAVGHGSITGPFVVAGLTSFALYSLGHPTLKSYAFTFWVFAFVSAGMYYPLAFDTWYGFDLGGLIVPLIQIIMFGMGTTLSLADFGRAFRMPWPVLVGVVLQYSVMPLAGFVIATSFGFEPEVAAGVVLIGSCSGGVASNLMTYLARGNVALSVTMTACSTILSPLMTPFLMRQLAGRFVPIDFVAMMLSIVNLIIVPIGCGLLAHKILYGRQRWENAAAPLAGGAVVCGVVAIGGLLVDSAAFGGFAAVRGGLVLGAGLIGAVCLAKLVINVLMQGAEDWMEHTLPVVSMAGICFILAIITSRSSEKLLSVGVALIAAAMLHNAVGYVLGYWASRAARLDESTCRTVAFEVGMQNGGMATALAMNVLNSANAALAPAIFGTWMNVSGSVLANRWHARPVAGHARQPGWRSDMRGEEGA